MDNMCIRLKLIFYYIEVKFSKLLMFFGFKHNSNVIPYGMYCYVYDEERNIKEPLKPFEWWVKTCKYYRSTHKSTCVACIYKGFYGFNPLLHDQCKICGINDYVDKGEDIDYELDINNFE